MIILESVLRSDDCDVSAVERIAVFIEYFEDTALFYLRKLFAIQICVLYRSADSKRAAYAENYEIGDLDHLMQRYEESEKQTYEYGQRGIFAPLVCHLLYLTFARSHEIFARYADKYFFCNDYADERENYVYYAENAFRINVNSEKTVSGTAVPYEVVITAKVLQEESINNYLFVEYKNKSTGKLDKGFYVYKDIAYFYELKENEYVCTLSMPLDISELTNRVLANDFGTEKNFNWMDAISYIIGALQVTTENIIFRYDSEFYNSVWFNAIDMLNYIDGHYNEDLQSMEEISSLIDFIKLPSVLTFSYHVPFLNIVEDQDSALSDTIGMLLASEPLLTLTPASQDTSNNDGTEDEVTENEGQEENMLVA